jgi:isopentenyl-diphosphate delta-isomerase
MTGKRQEVFSRPELGGVVEVPEDSSMNPVERRKREHMEIALGEDVQSSRGAGWDDVYLIPASLPELSADDVDTRVSFLGHELQAPIVISGMTGGHPAAKEINATLAAAAQELGLAMGLGSQRAAIVDPSLTDTYSIARDKAPSAFLLANLGVSQLVPQGERPALTAAQVREAVDMVRAQALAIHLNVLEELVQPEGDRNSAGFLAGIAEVVCSSPVPVIAKETGCGLDRESATLLAGAGVSAMDIGGAGGTSFALVEAKRAHEIADLRGARLGRTFANWGIPTVAAIVESRACGLPIIATGGVRSGLDVAKALALGADAVGMARPLLKAAQQGFDALILELRMLIEELRLAMLLSGATTVRDLRRRHPVVSGMSLEWSRQRGLL